MQKTNWMTLRKKKVIGIISDGRLKFQYYIENFSHELKSWVSSQP